MTDEHGDLMALLTIVGTWGLFFLGVWATPLDIDAKIIVDMASTIFFVFGSFMYFDYKGKIPIGKEKRIQVMFWLENIFMLFQAGLAFSLNVTVWKPVTINGYEVVTYDNLASFLFGIAGVFIVAYVLYRIKNRANVMARARTHRTKLI